MSATLTTTSIFEYLDTTDAVDLKFFHLYANDKHRIYWQIKQTTIEVNPISYLVIKRRYLLLDDVLCRYYDSDLIPIFDDIVLQLAMFIDLQSVTIHRFLQRLLQYEHSQRAYTDVILAALKYDNLMAIREICYNCRSHSKDIFESIDSRNIICSGIEVMRYVIGFIQHHGSKLTIDPAEINLMIKSGNIYRISYIIDFIHDFWDVADDKGITPHQTTTNIAQHLTRMDRLILRDLFVDD